VSKLCFKITFSCLNSVHLFSQSYAHAFLLSIGRQHISKDAQSKPGTCILILFNFLDNAITYHPPLRDGLEFVKHANGLNSVSRPAIP